MRSLLLALLALVATVSSVGCSYRNEDINRVVQPYWAKAYFTDVQTKDQKYVPMLAAADKPHVLWSLSKSFTSTAIGLAAAIPAVIAYNKLSSDANKMVGRLEGFADEFSAILSRQIDEGQA